MTDVTASTVQVGEEDLANRIVGSYLPRIDGLERVSGLAKFAADWKIDKMLYAAIVQSTVPHAFVKKIDLSKAEKLAGVQGIITCFDDETTWGEGERKHKRRVFTDHVRFIGDCIGAVAANSRNIAQEAAESIAVEYDELPGVFSPTDAIKDVAPKIWDDGNIIGPLKYGFGDLSKSFEKGDLVIERDYFTSRVHNAPLEPAVSLAWWEENRLTVVAATQGMYACQEGLASDLGLPLKNVRVICRYKGGGFGSKNSVMNYDLIAALLAKKTGRPVLLEYTREQEFTGVHGRWSTSQHVRAAVSRKDSRILAIDLKGYADVGAYSRHIYYPAYQTAFARFMDGPEKYYSCESWTAEVSGVYTNSPVTANMRAPTGPQACFAAETLADEIAHDLWIDPLEFRLLNATGKYPGSTNFLSNNMRECLEVGAEKFDWNKKWRRPQVKSNLGRVSGVGVAIANLHAFIGEGNAVLKLKKSGILEVYVGVIDIGTGAKSAMAMIAADALGLRMKDVRVISGDTDTCPYSIGESASRTTTFSGVAVRSAALKLRESVILLASSLLGSSDLTIKDGVVSRKDNRGKSITVGELLAVSNQQEITQVETTSPKLPEHKERFSFAAHFAEVVVDKETGQVEVKGYLVAQESGEIINKLTAESQVRGSVVMGIGMALYEKLLIDPNYGSIQNPSFLNYRLPGSLATPKIDVTFIQADDGFGPKSVGEISIVPVPAAIGNAIFNATGARLRRLPFVPEDVVNAININSD